MADVIPQPKSVRPLGGCYTLTAQSRICIDPADEPLSGLSVYLRDQIRRQTGLTLDTSSSCDAASDDCIELRLIERSDQSTDGAYTLAVGPNRITVSAASRAGLFYGIRTLIQLLPVDASSGLSITISAVEIEDEPRFTWRGMHLDVSRHFFSVAEIKKYIDLLAMHKMNIFHWHLTDDQGWRIEIKSYPRLTEISAFRNEADGTRYGGFYTQGQIREIVAYAQMRSVAVVPEIDLPGHTMAALAAYPEHSCTGGPFEIPAEWGIFDDVLCPGKEATFEFAKHILTEIIELFPGPSVHIGGDECPRTRWRACPLCQDLIKREGLRDENHLQSYFINRIAKFLIAHGKRPIGWDEIIEGGLPSGVAVMSWRGMEGGKLAIRAGHDAVMSPTSHCYFDYYQGKENEPKAIGGYLPLETVYEFEPEPGRLSTEETSRLLGGQGNVWTEYMPDFAHVEYMALPRMCAMAEVLWSPKDKRDFGDFCKRLNSHLARLDRLGVKYRRPDANVL